MIQNNSWTNESKDPPSNLIPPEFAAMGKKQLEQLAATQKDLMAKFQDANKMWFDRMHSEATLASEFAARLTAARSMPEVATAYQEWAQRHMEMAAADAKRIFTDGQKLAETAAHSLSSGWQPNGHGSST